MNSLTSQDQKLFPIPIVDNVIKEIHEINSNIYRLNPREPLLLASPPRLAENRKNKYEGTPGGTKDSFRATQDHVANKLRELHAKVNQVLTRNGSPIRAARIVETQQPLDPLEAYKTTAIKAGQTRHLSASRASTRTPETFDNSYSRQTTNAGNIDVHNTTYEAEIPKKATYTPQRTRTNYDSGAGKKVLFNLDSSYTTERELKSSIYEGSPMKSSLKTGKEFSTPTRTYEYSKTSSLASNSSREKPYDSGKVNQIIARVMAKRALEESEGQKRSPISNFIYNEDNKSKPPLSYLMDH